MQSVREIAVEIVRREGGFVDDPDDSGGATNHGVTIHTMRRLGLDLNDDGRVNVQDVRLLKQDQAIGIFIKHYFDQPKIALLPLSLQSSVFDMHVNAGAHAVRILQRLFNAMRFDLEVDGKIGPLTIAAARQAAIAAPDHLADAYAIARRNYYYALADQRPASRKYARRRDGGKGGWITRAEAFLAPRYHFSAAQHQQRTAQWG